MEVMDGLLWSVSYSCRWMSSFYDSLVYCSIDAWFVSARGVFWAVFLLLLGFGAASFHWVCCACDLGGGFLWLQLQGVVRGNRCCLPRGQFEYVSNLFFPFAHRRSVLPPWSDGVFACSRRLLSMCRSAMLRGVLVSYRVPFRGFELRTSLGCFRILFCVLISHERRQLRFLLFLYLIYVSPRWFVGWVVDVVCVACSVVWCTLYVSFPSWCFASLSFRLRRLDRAHWDLGRWVGRMGFLFTDIISEKLRRICLRAQYKSAM